MALSPEAKAMAERSRKNALLTKLQRARSKAVAIAAAAKLGAGTLAEVIAAVEEMDRCEQAFLDHQISAAA